MTKGLLAVLAAVLGGTSKLPEVRRIRRGETAGQAKRSAPAHIIAQRIEKANAKRARKAAARREAARV